MPRKPKREKHVTTVLVNDVPVRVVLHPPAGKRKCWYAYWPGQKYNVTTGRTDLNEAIREAKRLVEGGPKKPRSEDAVLSDEEFKEIQRAHFKKEDPAAQARAKKSLKDCLEAIEAFREISGLTHVSRATPDDCARFQREALTLPNTWRRTDARKERVDNLTSSNTVRKWSRQLQAAFERANRNAGKKCVRGVVDSNKLLTENPWTQFTWAVDEVKRPIRQFDGGELLSLLDHLKSEWKGVTVAAPLAKVYLWSWGRREEVASITWQQLRVVGDEHHFETVGKRDVKKWFRVPEGLYRELLAFKTDSPYVFAAYNEQVRRFYQAKGQPRLAMNVGPEFKPENLSLWFYRRISRWSKTLPKGAAYVHIFRKTSMQHARRGEDIIQRVAQDVRVSPSVMTNHYVEETDEQRQQESNRTYHRIVASLPPDVARRYGQDVPTKDPREEKLEAALAAKDWPLVARLSAELTGERSAAG
jgi:integrase